MIHIDLSKTPPLRIFIYLLALFPGLLFLSSVAIGNPQLAQAAVAHVKKVYPFPPYGLALILLGAAFVIGQAIILLSWMIDMLLRTLYRILRFLLALSLRKTFSQQRFVKWLANLQGAPPKHPLVNRAAAKLRSFAMKMPIPTQEAEAAAHCLVAATEKLLERRYGIARDRATGPRGGRSWDVWCSVVGKPIKSLTEALNAGRTFFACGLAGFIAIEFAPRLNDTYFLALCSIFAFSGLWTSFVVFFKEKNLEWHHGMRLRAVLLELQEWSDIESDGKRAQKGDNTGNKTAV